jgi:hypothetical protein
VYSPHVTLALIAINATYSSTRSSHSPVHSRLSRSATTQVVPIVVPADLCCHYLRPALILTTGNPSQCVLATSSHYFQMRRIAQDASPLSHTKKLLNQFG